MPNKERLKKERIKMPNNMVSYTEVKNYRTNTPGGYDGATGESYRYIGGVKVAEDLFAANSQIPSPYLTNQKGANPDGKHIN